MTKTTLSMSMSAWTHGVRDATLDSVAIVSCKRFARTLAIAVVLCRTTEQLAGQEMCWASFDVNTNGASMMRVSLDGGEPTPVLNIGVNSIAFDTVNQTMYYSGGGGIWKANLDGSAPENVVSTGFRMALDLTAGRIFWTDRNNQRIQRSNIDGSVVETIVDLTGEDTPNAIALDPAERMVYWTGINRVARIGMEGTGEAETLVNFSGPANGLALDLLHRKMYWTNQGDGRKVQRASLDGSGVQDIVTNGAGDPIGIALDVPGNRVYWSDQAGRKIRSAKLDGSDFAILVETEDAQPGSLAILDDLMCLELPDSDGDGVSDVCDGCPQTIPMAIVDREGCPPSIPGDFDHDGDVDHDDFGVFQRCLSGPNTSADPNCAE